MPLQKRKYSRAGCGECKRRKIKCDEVHPVCGNCMRVDAACVFPAPGHRNKPRQTPTASLGQSNTLRESSVVGSGPGAYSISSGGSGGSENPALQTIMPDEIDMLFLENVFGDASTLVHGIVDFDPWALDSDVKPFDSDIILNGDDREWKSVFQLPASAPPAPGMSNLDLVAALCAQYNLRAPERYYLTEMVAGQFACYFFPFASDPRSCPVTRAVLQYLAEFKYLLYAVIAMGASLAFNVSGDANHDRSQKRYTSECKRLLVAAFDHMAVTTPSLIHIEGLIWTVLLLTLLFYDMRLVDNVQLPVSWTAHLNEARALLAKYDAAKRGLARAKRDSEGVTYARLLFFSCDWLGKLSSPALRASAPDFDRALLFSSFDADTYTLFADDGVVIPRGPLHSPFNMILSMTPEVVEAAYLLFETMGVMQNVGARKRDNGPAPPQHPPPPTRRALPAQVCAILGALDRALRQKIVPDISAETNYRVDPASPAHPDYSGTDRIVLPAGAFARHVDEFGATHYYSWCDMAQRLNAYSVYLKVLTTPGLLHVPRNHPMVRSIVREVMALLFFVREKTESFRPEWAVAHTAHYYLPKSLFDLHIIVIHLPFIICIDLVENEDDIEKLELVIVGILEIGGGNTTLKALDRIARARERMRAPPAEEYVEDEYAEALPMF